jgi:hypothetical protein
MEIPFTLRWKGICHNSDVLRENVEYEVVFSRELEKKEKEVLQRNYPEILSVVYGTYVLKFKNYVGKISFLGRTLQIVSSKWSPEQVNRMWLEVSEQAAALLYSHISVVKQYAHRSHQERDVFKYQQWVFLRDQLLYRFTFCMGVDFP